MARQKRSSGPLKAELRLPTESFDAHVQTKQASRVAPSVDLVGQRVDARYEITEFIGEGGMGAVFAAKHLGLGKEVAFKVIRPEYAQDSDAAARFAREALAVAQFEHPNIASATDFGTLPEGGAYLVLELVRGPSLRTLLDEKEVLPWSLVVDLGAQVSDALAAAQSAGIVHRDLKPENILLKTLEDGGLQVKLLDFGVARFVIHHVSTVPPDSAEGPGDAQLTRLGMVVGTPGYMAPEQAVGDAVDHRADLYALGAILWESLAGRPLWRAPTVAGVIGRQLSEAPTNLNDVVAGIPSELVRIVMQLLAKSRSDRPSDAREVRDDLRGLQKLESLRATPLSTASESQLTGRRWPAVARVVGARRAVSRWCRLRWQKSLRRRQACAEWLYRRWRAVAALIAVALAGAAAGYALGHPADALGGAGSLGADRASESTSAASSDKVPGADMPKARAILEATTTLLANFEATGARDAARVVIDAEGTGVPIPAVLVGIARLAQASSCRELRQAIATLVEAHDARARPSLERLDARPKNGCGFGKETDCIGCIRGNIQHALLQLP